MKLKKELVLLSVMVIFFNCAFVPSIQIINKLPDDAIKVAISDFSRKCKLYRNGRVFFVNSQMNLKDENTILISVIEMETIFPVPINYILDSTVKLPSQTLIKDGKLFYWWDDNVPLTKATIDIYKKYNMLVEDSLGQRIPYTTLDDSKKGVRYYFCKKDLSRFKRIITNRGNYPAPALNCSPRIAKE